MSTTSRHVELRGPSDAPAIVLLPSLGTQAALWDLVATVLEERWRLVLIEHPGHRPGAGPTPVAASVEAYGREVLEVLDALGIERAHVVGVSIGGAIALALARDHPERIPRLGVVGAPRRFGSAEAWHERAAAVRANGTASLVDGLLERWVPTGWSDANPSERDQVADWVRACDDEAYARHCEALAKFLFAPDRTVETPTLLVTGRDDPVAPPAAVLDLAASFAAATVVVLGRSRHLPCLSEPRALATLLDDHLSGRLDD